MVLDGKVSRQRHFGPRTRSALDRKEAQLWTGFFGVRSYY